jgi:hypothetical protein
MQIKWRGASQLESSDAAANAGIDHSAVAHAPNIRQVAVGFHHTIDVEAIGVDRVAVGVTGNPKPSIRAGNSAIEQRKHLR